MIVSQHVAGVTTLALDRPERRNALDRGMIRDLADAIAAAEADAACRCLVITGKGGTFCSGRDLADARDDAPLGDILAYDEAWTDILHRLKRLTKPSVAVVEGHAVAGGFTLAMGCDFVLAERGAKFGALEMRGGFPAAVNTAVLSHLVGPRVALEYLLSADTFPADHLLRTGLLNRIADGPVELEQIAREFTERLAALDPIAVKLTKEAHRMASAMPVGEAIVMGRQLNALLMSSGVISAARDRLTKGGKRS